MVKTLNHVPLERKMKTSLTALSAMWLLALASCQTVPASGFCDIAKPIRLSPEQIDKLTDEQVRQVLGHNQRGAKLCGWKP